MAFTLIGDKRFPLRFFSETWIPFTDTCTNTPGNVTDTSPSQGLNLGK